MIKQCSIVVLVLSASANLRADVRLPALFSDHMVLQRDRPIHVRGWAERGSEVTVEFAEQTAKATVGDDGTWSVTIGPLVSSAEGKELLIQSTDQAIAIQDVVVGDVWHASGQSNMAMTVGAMARALEPVKSDIATANLPAIRFCRINESESPQPLDDLRARASWMPCSPTTAVRFSGIAFYFAKQLHAELDVPVGIIDTLDGIISSISERATRVKEPGSNMFVTIISC